MIAIFFLLFFFLPKVFVEFGLQPTSTKPNFQVSIYNLFAKKLFLVLFLVSFLLSNTFVGYSATSTRVNVECLGINIIEREV